MRKGIPAAFAALAFSFSIPFQVSAMPSYVFRDV